MRARLLLGALALNLHLFPALAQQASEAESHIASAFTSRADRRVLAADVKLGPALAAELGAEADGRRVYGALLERIAGRVRVSLLPPAEAARHAALVGSAADPLVVLEAGDVTLLMQYVPAKKEVAFVEQLSKPAPRAEPPPQLPPELQKPAPVVAVPLAPPVAEKPKPPAAAPAVATVPPPTPPPAAPRVLALPPPAALAKPEKPKPEPKPPGECVIKPVMSDEDLRNCAAVQTSRSAPVTQPAPAAVEKPSAPPPPARAPAECIIKPVMSDEELRACGVRR